MKKHVICPLEGAQIRDKKNVKQESRVGQWTQWGWNYKSELVQLAQKRDVLQQQLAAQDKYQMKRIIAYIRIWKGVKKIHCKDREVLLEDLLRNQPRESCWIGMRNR